MARTNKAAESTTLAGLAPTMTTMPATGANNGFTLTGNTGDQELIVKNAGVGAATLTFDATGRVAGIAISDQTASCANDSVVRHYGPFPPEVFGSSVGVDSDVATGVTVGWVTVART